MNSNATEVIVVVACVVGIIAGIVFIGSHVDVHCFNWFGLAKGCVASTK